MIAFLRGKLLEKHPNQVIVETAGVGYDVVIPSRLSPRSRIRAPKSRCGFTPTFAKMRWRCSAF